MNFYVSDFDENRLKQNFRNTDHGLRDASNFVVISAPEIIETGGASRSNIVGVPSIAMPDASTTACRMLLRVPSLWKSGNLKFSLYLATSTLTGNVQMSLNYMNITDGLLISSVNIASNKVITIGAASTTKKHTFTDQLAISSQDFDLLSLTLLRIGAGANDTLAANVHVIGFKVEYQPEIT